jgi:hypothetical protein
MTVMGVIYALMLCAAIGTSIFMFVSSIQESSGLFQALFLPLFCTGVFLAPGAIIFYQQWWKGVFNVAFYEHGLAINSRNGVTEIPWNQLDAIWLEWARSGGSRYSSATNKTYAFRTKSGEEFRLRSNLEGFNEFEEKFHKPAYFAVMQNQLNDLQSGKRVMVYGIGVDREGLTYGKKSIRWSEMEALRIEKSQLMVKQGGQWKTWETFAFNIPHDLIVLARTFVTVE